MRPVLGFDTVIKPPTQPANYAETVKEILAYLNHAKNGNQYNRFRPDNILARFVHCGLDRRTDHSGAYSPALRKKGVRKRAANKKLMDTIQKRNSILVYVSMVGLVLTGFLQTNRSPAFEGLFSFGNAYSALLTVKHILVIAIITVSLYRSLTLRNTSAPTQEKLKATLLILNIIFGISVLLLSGFTAALSSGIPVA